MSSCLRALLLSVALLATPLAALAQPSVTAQSVATDPPLDDEDIRDIRGPFESPEPWWSVYGPWIALGLAAAGALALGARWLARKRAPDAYAIALAELARARESMERGTGAAFSDTVSAAVRRYIEARFDVHAPTSTTDELLRELADSERSPLRAHRERLLELLAFCDLARFGGFSLAREEMASMHATAVRFVEETWRAKEAPTSEVSS